VKELDIRHKSIIDSLPVWEAKNEILTVGCGDGFIEDKLQSAGYNIIATDYFEKSTREDTQFLDNLQYHKSDIFDLSSFPVEGRETVICSEVLEHLPNYQEAFNNLLQLTHRRLIITIPWNTSYDVSGPPPEGHCNYWTDNGEDPFCNHLYEAARSPHFKNVREFITMAWPYHVTISKIATKGEDWVRSSRCYLIVVDKMQQTDFVWRQSQIPHVWNLIKEESGRYRPELMSIENYSINGQPPTRIGPYMPYDIQPICIFLTSPERTQDRDFLFKLEHRVNDMHDMRLFPLTLEPIDGIENFYNDLNLTFHIPRIVIDLEGLSEDFDHSVNSVLRRGIKAICIGKQCDDYKEYYDSTIEICADNDELIEKITSSL